MSGSRRRLHWLPAFPVQFRALPPGPHNCFDIGDLLVAETVEFVCNEEISRAPDRVLATVMFIDIVGSTELLSAQGDARWREQLGVHDTLVDVLLDKYGGRRVKHTGDGVFAIFDAPTLACQFGLELSAALGTRGIPIRVGIHVGECERRGEEWSGLAVHIGARVGAMAGAGEVLTSKTVRELSVGSGLVFEDLGAQRLKGLSDDVNVTSARPLRVRVTRRCRKRSSALLPRGWSLRQSTPAFDVPSIDVRLC